MNKIFGALTDILTGLGLLKPDVDYHLIRASMVLIFAFFGYQKWFEYRSASADTVHQQRSAHFLALSAVWYSRRQLVSGCCRMAVRLAPAAGILGQANGNSRSDWLDSYFRRDGHHHSVHA